jgi:hypothetical protein
MLSKARARFQLRYRFPGGFQDLSGVGDTSVGEHQLPGRSGGPVAILPGSGPVLRVNSDFVSASHSLPGVVRMYVTWTKRSGSIDVSFEVSFEVIKRPQTRALIFFDPPVGDLVYRDRIEVVQLLASPFHRSYEIGILQYRQVFGHSLPCDVPVFA